MSMHPMLELSFNHIPGFLSEKQLSEHYKLYVNYYNQTQDLPEKINGLGESNPAGIRGPQKTLQYALAGRDLHEIYFSQISEKETSLNDIPENLKTLIEKSFGSVETWISDFKACALAARGWCVLEFDPRNEILYNVISDVHDEGGTIGFQPILALDMYEHAFFYDYQTGKKTYIEAWLSHIDWSQASYNI